MKSKNKIISVCNKCGKQQVPDKSNKNWDVFTTNKCDCGGKFEFKLDSLKVKDTSSIGKDKE